MSAKEIFGIGVRIIGLWSCVYAILYFVSAFNAAIDSSGIHSGMSSSQHYYIEGAVSLIIGMYLLRGAPHIIRFAYGYEASKSETEKV